MANKITFTEENQKTAALNADMYMVFIGNRVGENGLDVHVKTNLIGTDVDEQTTFYVGILNSLANRAKENTLFKVVCAAFNAGVFEGRLPPIEDLSGGPDDE